MGEVLGDANRTAMGLISFFSLVFSSLPLIGVSLGGPIDSVSSFGAEGSSKTELLLLVVVVVLVSL